MKKLLVMFLVFVMVLVTFSACKEKADKNGLKYADSSELSEEIIDKSGEDKEISSDSMDNMNSSQPENGNASSKDTSSVKKQNKSDSKTVSKTVSKVTSSSDKNISSKTASKSVASSSKSSSSKTASKSTSSSKKSSSSKPSGNESSYSAEKSQNPLPDYNLDTDYTNDYTQDDRYIKIKSFASSGEYTDYVNQLIKSGYKKYDENKIGKNLFVSLINGKRFISVAYTDGNKKLKIISEPLGSLYPRKQDNKYTSKGMTSLFTGMKNQNYPIYSGMGFVFRLDDGSFIIIDGGGGDREHKDSNNLLDILNEQKPKGSGKPVIAAWIFTHCHDDHIGVFNVFSEDFHDKVIIENFYYNFPSNEDIVSGAGYMLRDSYASYSTFKKCMGDYYPKSGYIRPHTGEKIYIRNCVIEMLFSYEDLFPASVSGGGIRDFNETSLMFKMNIGGQSILITGDACAMGMNFVCVNYGSYLKSDILQMAHHGQNGTVQFYSLVNPKYALMPISHVDTNRVKFNDANKWLINSKNLRQIITFWGQNVTLSLPYNPSDAEIKDRIPKANTKY